MNKEEQRIYYEKALADAIGEYKHVSCLVDAIRICVTDIDFEEKFPVSQERYLLVEKMKASEGVQTNLRNSIRFYRAMLKANKPEPWEEDSAHHCGQDADMDDACCQARGHQPEGYTYKDLLGMEVIGIGGKSMKCEGCPTDCGNCVKVELAGGDYICLTKRQADEEEDGNVMGDIKEKVEEFVDYLESVVKD